METTQQRIPSAKNVKPKGWRYPAGFIDQPVERGLLRFLPWVFGTIRHVPILSPELDWRVRARYQSEIRELTRLGFEYLCSAGESFSLLRLLLVLPALVLALMQGQRMPMALRGRLILVGYPVLVSRIKPAFVHPFGLGVKFFTGFQDGTLLVSGNYADPTARGPGIIRQFQPGTVSEAWAAHQARIQALEAAGAIVNRPCGYDAYVEMSQRDTAAW